MVLFRSPVWFKKEAQVESLDAQVKEQQVQLRYYKVESPWTGVVGDIPVHVGDRVTTSTLLTTVDKPGGLEAYIYVPIERSSQLKMNRSVQILDSNGKVLANTRISFISPQVDNTTQTVLVKTPVSVPGTLRTDQYVRSHVIWTTEPGLTVPVTAVTRINGQWFAFVAEPGEGGKGLIAHQRSLELGPVVGNNYTVVSGLKQGEKLIVGGIQKIRDGAPVSATASAPARQGGGA